MMTGEGGKRVLLLVDLTSSPPLPLFSLDSWEEVEKVDHLWPFLPAFPMGRD